VEQLGRPEEIFERTKVLPARVVLTGPWYDWFMRDVFNAGRVADSFIGEGKGVELLDADPGQLKLSAAGVTKLREAIGKLTAEAMVASASAELVCKLARPAVKKLEAKVAAAKAREK
jgi:hypothetical protein